jgi:hypothetical protein
VLVKQPLREDTVCGPSSDSGRNQGFILFDGKMTVTVSCLFTIRCVQVHTVAILLLRLVYREGSLAWYLSQPEVFCYLLSPG